MVKKIHETVIRLCAIGAVIMCMTSCEKMIPTDQEMEDDATSQTGEEVKTKKFTFTAKGDFTMKNMRAASYLDGEDNTLTDLWVFDYMDGELQQQLHQTPEDAEWGHPVMQLRYGNHHIYFVASRGASPVVVTDTRKMTWQVVRDTFWKDYEVEVKNTSNGNRAVTLDRVVAKLQLLITDPVPVGVAAIVVGATKGSYSLDYTTGEPVGEEGAQSSVSVPESKIGTSNLSVVNYLLCPSDGMLSDITLMAANASGQTIYNVDISDVPLQRNYLTSYNGSLFLFNSTSSVSVDYSWGGNLSGVW